MHFKSGIKKYHSYSTLNLWHKMRFKKKKRKKFTLHSASSFLFFPQSECFCVSSQLPLFLMVSAGARQGARWQVGYRQWYWFHYSSSHCLPAWLTAAPIQHFTFCLCRAVVTNTQSCKQGENKEERGLEKKRRELTCALTFTCTHQPAWCTYYPTVKNDTHTDTRTFTLHAA